MLSTFSFERISNALAWPTFSKEMCGHVTEKLKDHGWINFLNMIEYLRDFFRVCRGPLKTTLELSRDQIIIKLAY